MYQIRISGPEPCAAQPAQILVLCFLLVACDPPPEGPRQETETGALGLAIVQAGQPGQGLTAGVAAVGARSAARAAIPYIVIRFDRRHVTYEDALYSALSRALERYPAAAFDIVLAMPPLAADAGVDEATARGERHIEEVVLLMTDMGMPPERVRVAATTDAAAEVDEIRIFVH
jgi:hypothetical protein